MAQPDNLISMARVEISQDPLFGYLITGPTPIIRGSRFFPGQEIRIEVTCVDSNSRPWKSCNAYRVSRNGSFDTSIHAPLDGQGYQGVNREGPFTSMRCQLGAGNDFGVRGLRVLSYLVTAFDGDTEIFSEQVHRYQGEGLTATKPWVNVMLFSDDLIGDDSDAVAALCPYGISASRHILEECCSQPESSDPPQQHRQLPTYIIGSGRASARALEAAIRLPEIQAVLLFSGGGLRFDPELDGRGAAPLEGEPTPSHLSIDTDQLEKFTGDYFSTIPLYEDALKSASAVERSRIKVERIPCPVIMFSGRDDQVWPSSLLSEQVTRRRKAQKSPYPTVHHIFEDVGHDLGPSLGLPTLPTTERSTSHCDTFSRLLLGGKTERQARARRACWDSMLAVLCGHGTEDLTDPSKVDEGARP